MCKKEKIDQIKVFPFSRLLENYFLIEIMNMIYHLSRVKDYRTVSTLPQLYVNTEFTIYSKSKLRVSIFGGLYQAWVLVVYKDG